MLLKLMLMLTLLLYDVLLLLLNVSSDVSPAAAPLFDSRQLDSPSQCVNEWKIGAQPAQCFTVYVPIRELLLSEDPKKLFSFCSFFFFSPPGNFWFCRREPTGKERERIAIRLSDSQPTENSKYTSLLSEPNDANDEKSPGIRLTGGR